jgi:hypothetical protein
MQTKGQTARFEPSKRQRLYTSTVLDGHEPTHEEMEDLELQTGLESAARTGDIDPDDPSLAIPEHLREFLRDRAGKPTRWETEPESRPPWLRSLARERAEASRQYAMVSIAKRGAACGSVRVRCRAPRSRERRPRCHSRRQAGITRAGPDDAPGDPPSHPPTCASSAGGSCS